METRRDVKRATGRTPTASGSRHACGLLLVAAVLSAASVGSTARDYTAEPITARVVDAETGAPVEGVNVVAAWVAKGGLEGGNITGFVTVMEDVTNPNGEFSFPGWGPKKWTRGAIRNGAPQVVILKPGYEYRTWYEPAYGVDFAPSHLKSSLNGKSLPIKRSAGTIEAYSRRLFGIKQFSDDLAIDSSCAWKGAPQFLRTVDRMHTEFVATKLYSLASLGYMSQRANRTCGDLALFVLENSR